MDATALLAQSAAWGTSSIATSGSDAAAKSPGDLQNALPGATAVASKVTNSGTTGPRPAVTPVSVPEGGAQLTALQTEQPSEGLQKALKTAVEAKGMAATQAVPKAESAQPVDGKLAALLNQKPVDGDTAQLATALASAAANVVSTPRREESSRERSVFRTSNDSAASPQALSTPAPTHIVSGAPEVVPATDVFVAEKVSYWVSNNVQNAEMKLDGVGDRPVEVSIRMQGNEAHVAFRTDELQTRAALENASVHLKDLLHREGLVLSGVSVGTADTGGSSGPQQDRKPRQGERQATVTALQPLTGDLRTGPGRVSRGSLDLFV
jgi:flagellar hook-length control protein FliK